jgi:hypothetical protein
MLDVRESGQRAGRPAKWSSGEPDRGQELRGAGWGEGELARWGCGRKAGKGGQGGNRWEKQLVLRYLHPCAEAILPQHLAFSALNSIYILIIMLYK